MDKTNHHNISDSNATKKVKVKKPLPWYKNWANDLLLWADVPTSLRIEDFYLSKRITHKRYYNYIADYPELKEAHDYAMERIGSNRDRIICDNRLGASSGIAYPMSAYSVTWKQAQEEKAKLRQAQEEQDIKKLIAISNDFKKDLGE